MAIFYIDFENGNDANDGSTWANAWKTFTTGATAARIAPGDEIRVAKSADPTSLGQTALWTGIDRIYDEITPTSSTNATPIVITKAGHGVINGDIVQVYGHTVNTNANGKWKATKINDDTFSLDGSVGNGVGGASGKFSVINHRVVQLTNAVTQDICNCDDAWTAGAGCTVTKEVTIVKDGTGSVKIVCGTSGANQILARFALPASLDLSAYEQISFWFHNSAALAAGAMEIRLYSDTACTTLVETLPIGACVNTGRMRPEVINKGSALSATVQGIALYAVTSQSGKTYYLDNIIACKASTAPDSITLRSLISKNVENENGDHAFLGIQSIKDKWLFLDNIYATYTNVGKGYSGETQNIITHKKEAILFDTTNMYTQVINEAGTTGNLISFIGGYNVITNERDGFTAIDGIAGYKVGFHCPKANTDLSFFQATRFSTAFNYLYGSKNLIATNCSTNGFLTYPGNYNNIFAMNNATGFNTASSSGVTSLIDIVSKNNLTIGIFSFNLNTTATGLIANNNGTIGIRISNTAHKIDVIKSASFNNIGISVNSSTPLVEINQIIQCNFNATGIELLAVYTRIFLINNLNNNSGALKISGHNNFVFKIEKANYTTGTFITFNYAVSNYIYEIQEAINATAILFAGTPVNCFIYKGMFSGYTGIVGYVNPLPLYLIDCTVDQIQMLDSQIYNGRVYQHNYNFTGRHRITTEYGYIEDESLERHSQSGVSWKIAIINAIRTSEYPIKFSIAKIYCTGGSQAILACWVKKTHSTDIGARLLVDHFINPTIAAVDVIQVAAETTNWQQLILYVTPLADGVIELTLEVFWQANEADEFVYVDDVSAAQLT